jgi:hypothetical protein
LILDHQQIERMFVSLLRALHQLLIDFPVTHAA